MNLFSEQFFFVNSVKRAENWKDIYLMKKGPSFREYLRPPARIKMLFGFNLVKITGP